MDRAVKHPSGQRVKFQICTWKSWCQLHGLFLHEGVCTYRMSIYVLTQVHTTTELIFPWCFLHKAGKKKRKNPPQISSSKLPQRQNHESMHHLIYSFTSIFILLAASVFQSSLRSMPRAEQLKVKVLAQGSSLEVLGFSHTTFWVGRFLCDKAPWAFPRVNLG